MKNMKISQITLLAGAMLALASMIWAADDPHGGTNSIYCEQCHITHNSLGDILINSTDSLVSTLCLSCHTPGGWVPMTKALSSADKADPGVSGTSHAWDVAAVNTERSTQLPQTQALLDHLTSENKVTCATCHDPHANSVSPFLRLDNSADAMCLDCHRTRDNSSVRTYTGSELSHPVGQALPATTDFHNPPLDVDGNPQPSDGNTTNDYVLGAGDVVSCTSCHGIHFTDSESSTVDGP